MSVVESRREKCPSGGKDSVISYTTTHSPWDKKRRHCNSICLDMKCNTICMLGFHFVLFVLGKFHFDSENLNNHYSF